MKIADRLCVAVGAALLVWGMASFSYSSRMDREWISLNDEVEYDRPFRPAIEKAIWVQVCGAGVIAFGLSGLIGKRVRPPSADTPGISAVAAEH